MKIIFTLCSNNYLAQAKTLGDSIIKNNPEYLFIIGLVDLLQGEINYEAIGYKIVQVTEIGISNLEDLWKKYSIVEFNTCVKPFYFKYFINYYKSLSYLFYIDPDIVIYNDLGLIEKEFGGSGKILLTPHILTPIPLDKKIPGENSFLKFGIYNLGFLGLKEPDLLVINFIDWWKERTFFLGFDQTINGLFVDQLWINLVPIFFERVKISEHPGLNMAPWNLHERKLLHNRSVIFMGNRFPLVFYHFSKYNLSEPDVINKYYDRFNFETEIDLKNLYLNYSQLLIENGIKKFSTFPCQYMILQNKYLEEVYELEAKILTAKTSFLKRLLKFIFPHLARFYKKLQKLFKV